MQTRLKTSYQHQYKQTSLVVIDEAPLRAQAMHELKEAQSELDRLNHEFAVFQERDKPAFSMWYQTTFGRVLNELQELAWRVLEKRALIAEVLEEASRSGQSLEQAYHEVVERMAGGQIDANDENGDEGAGAAFDSDTDTDEPRAKDTSEAKFQAANPGGAEDRVSEGREKLKQLYRSLARLLHPDVNGGKSGGHRYELWLRVQAAYEAGDLERLKNILALLDAKEHEERIPDAWSIGELRRQVAQVLDAALAMRRRLHRVHRDRAWGFSREGANRRMRRAYRLIQSELTQELSEAQEALAALEEFIEEQFNSKSRARASNARRGHRRGR